MSTITLAGLKGGTGKTTSAVYLSVAAHRDGADVCLLDADPQRSALAWAEAAGGFGFPVVPLVGKKHRAEIDYLAGRHELVVVDCPPGETDVTITSAAIAAADLVLVPVAPTGLDVHRLVRSLDLAESLGAPAAALIVKTDERWRAHRQLVDAIGADTQIAMIGTTIPRTVRISGAFEQPLGTDLFGYERVWSEVREVLKEND